MKSRDIAIISCNIFTRKGLKEMLSLILPQQVIIRSFDSFETFICDTPDMYIHCFLDAQLFIEHSHFFQERRKQLILLTNGEGTQTQMAGMHTLNLYTSEKEMLKELAILMKFGHQAHPQKMPNSIIEKPLLTQREIEVLVLITQGLINKEIATRLNIALSTVISHRKNIVRKLGMKSVSALTIYAVINGYIDADRI
jgi:DNA-binding CsgD family transcriptional regulator